MESCGGCIYVASAMLALRVLFLSLRLCIMYVSAEKLKRKQLMRNCCDLVGMCVGEPSSSNWILANLISDLHF